MSLRQCLFNPQLDIYAYQKHFRDTTSVLTFPQSLHDYHRDGFPALLAFRDGRQIYNGGYSDWEGDVRRLSDLFWPERQPATIRLASGRKQAENHMTESRNRLMITVVPNGSTDLHADMTKAFANRQGFPVKYENELTEDDFRQHLTYQGGIDRFGYNFLGRPDSPIRIDSQSVRIGGYTFPVAETGVRAVFPNPVNPEKYVSLALSAPGQRRLMRASHTDFCIWRYDTAKKENTLLLDGQFAKVSGNEWRFDDALAVRYVNLNDYCEGGVCPVPAYLLKPEENHAYVPQFSSWTKAGGDLLSIGVDNCRFPSITVNSRGEVGLAWEENGDIIFAVLEQGEAPRVIVIENGYPDCYNPRVVWDGASFFIVYLGNRETYYHLFGRFIDLDRLSDEIRITGPSSYDVITPALASNGDGTIAVAWTEWVANLRFPRYRLVVNRTLQPPDSVPVVASGIGDYANAWWISLDMDKSGRPWGAWNQHYPATVTPCGGPLSGPVSAATQLTGNVETSEIGEYPSTVLDAQGNQWLAWTTYGREPYAGRPQNVLVARYDALASAWITPYTISHGFQTWYNQTPRMAAGPDGKLWVVWSGRPKEVDRPWGVYLSAFEGRNQWTSPRLISDPSVCARAPEISVGPDGRPWITWHAGTGRDMRVQVWVAD